MDGIRRGNSTGPPAFATAATASAAITSAFAAARAVQPAVAPSGSRSLPASPATPDALYSGRRAATALDAAATRGRGDRGVAGASKSDAAAGGATAAATSTATGATTTKRAAGPSRDTHPVLICMVRTQRDKRRLGARADCFQGSGAASHRCGREVRGGNNGSGGKPCLC